MRYQIEVDELGGDFSTPVLNATEGDFLAEEYRALEAGDSHTLALQKDGEVLAWGRNDFGQLGDGGTKNHSMPMEVNTLFAISAVSA